MRDNESSLNDQRKEKQIIDPDRLMKLPDLQTYLKLPGSYPIAKVSFKVHKLHSVAADFVAKEPVSY